MTYLISGLTRAYDPTSQTQFSLYLDAGAHGGAGTQARVSYDFTGDGTYDRIETYQYFATNDVAGWEAYSAGQGIKAASGSFSNLSNGTLRLELWNAIGNGRVAVRTSATAANGQQSTLSLPFN